MTVFRTFITSFVILSAVCTQSAHAQWQYQVDLPVAPNLTQTKYLTNPTVSQIQATIKPHTKIIVIGEVDASSGDVLEINADDVRINFARANVVHWSGGDTWRGFINITGSRVQIVHLRLNVASAGKCRGVVLETPASDVRIAHSTFENTSDGLVADGNWERLYVMRTKFLNCGTWSDPSMPGGYGMFLEDDDWNPDHLRINHVTITLASNSWQHGIRISQVQNSMVQNSHVGANEKRSFWAYGVDRMAVTNCTFTTGSVLFNLMAEEWYTERATTRVRMQNCRIEHDTILQPLGVYCGRGTRDLRVRNIDIVSESSPEWLSVGWRTDADSRNICWGNGSINFNGSNMHGYDGTKIPDWNNNELANLNIGPM